MGWEVLAQASFLPVSTDLGVIKGDVLLWAGALMGVLLLAYAAARMLEIVDDEPEDEED